MYVDVFGQHHRYGPPPGWVRPERESFSASAAWARLIERGLRFEPYSGPSLLNNVRGDCLEPLIVAGKHLLRVRSVAPDELLVDGGLYVIRWDCDEETQSYRSRIGVPATEQIVIAKFLRYIGGEWWCQSSDSICRLDGTVVGQVVGVIAAAAGCAQQAIVHARQPYRNPWAEDSAACGQLGVNAASQMLGGYFASGALYSQASGPTSTNIATAPQVSIYGTGAPAAIDLSCGQSEIYINGAVTSWSVSYAIYRNSEPIPATTTVTYDSVHNSGWSANSWLNLSPLMFSVVDPTPPFGLNTYTLYISAIGASGGSYLQVYNLQITMKVREIKK